MAKLNIVQYGCGKMSVYTMRYVHEKGGKIVGAFDLSSEVIGKDIGEVIGDGKKYGVKVQDAKKFEAYLEKGYYVLEKDNKIVSQAVFSRNLLKGKCISGVYTPKEERGKGYAYNLVYTLSKKCLDEGAEYCVLYTDAENPISNHVYEKIGYVKRVECEELEFYE